MLHKADWRWTIAALALSAATYVAATEALIGFVPGRLSFRRTLLAQLASSFVTLVTPAAVGGATLNIRYLQRQKISAAVAAASVGVSQVVAFVLHVLLILVFAAIAGSSASEPVHAAAVGLVRAGRPGPHRARGAGHPRRAADAARPPVADAGPGAAAAARGRAAPGQARPGHRRHAAAQLCPTSSASPPAWRRSAGRCRSRKSAWCT